PPRIGNDVDRELWLTFEEAALGCEKRIGISKVVPCGPCEGSGASAGTKPFPCEACGGAGQVRAHRSVLGAFRPCDICGGSGRFVRRAWSVCEGTGTLERPEDSFVKIPPGVEDRATRTVRGAGEIGPGGAGDLHLHVRIYPHPFFQREGADITCTVPISFPQAVLGAEIEVPTLQGKSRLKLHPGTPSGRVFRMRGKGISVLGGYGRGDQLVRTVVEVPESITPRQRELLEELERTFEPDSH